jgi:hypothetical protein
LCKLPSNWHLYGDCSPYIFSSARLKPMWKFLWDRTMWKVLLQYFLSQCKKCFSTLQFTPVCMWTNRAIYTILHQFACDLLVHPVMSDW